MKRVWVALKGGAGDFMQDDCMSMGAALAYAYLARHPDQVRGLVLVAPALVGMAGAVEEGRGPGIDPTDGSIFLPPRGISNNVSVDGADFNNPFFGEQRGGRHREIALEGLHAEERLVQEREDERGGHDRGGCGSRRKIGEAAVRVPQLWPAVAPSLEHDLQRIRVDYFQQGVAFSRRLVSAFAFGT